MLEIKGKYTSALVTNDNTEEEAIAQIYSIVNCKAYDGCKIVIQPDAHCGKGSVIGFCCKIGNYVDPRTVGVDIGCEISMHLYDKPIPEDKYAELNHRILNECGWGFNLSPKKMYDDKELYRFLSTEFRKAKSAHPDIFYGLPDTVTEKWVTDMLDRIGMDEKTWYYSINSFGSGNHYCEYDVNEDAGLYGISVHCGSRNFGVKVCNYWENKSKGGSLSKTQIKEATEIFKQKYIKEHTNSNGSRDMAGFKDALKVHLDFLQKDHIEGFLTGEKMKGYFCDMYGARCYAMFNHIVIHRVIDSMVAKYGCKVVEEIVSVHNYIDFSEKTPIIRKGAIRSYEGEKMLVPFNMRDGVAICEGKSNADWLNSCSHGAGRKMSRSEAKRTLTLEEFKTTMDGIYSTTVCTGTIDESPMAYKDTNEIANLIVDTCVIKYMMKPRINIKATDEVD